MQLQHHWCWSQASHGAPTQLMMCCAQTSAESEDNVVHSTTLGNVSPIEKVDMKKAQHLSPGDVTTKETVIVVCMRYTKHL